MPIADVLPVHLSHFIGRTRELGQLDALLPTTRLLTLTGAGGSGKTRLAAQLAARHAAQYERMEWVDFAPLAGNAHVAQYVARALHIPEGVDVAPVDALTLEIGTARALLILDNCEHVVDDCAQLVEHLLTACGRLTILATSREALSIASETAWLVPPLAEDEAMLLFGDRARGALPTFAIGDGNSPAIAEICSRLDGIPLAIELAAARVRALTPAQIAERLDDAFRLLNAGSRTALPRHRTLRGTMDWSYDLLNAREQQLLARLSVFAGGFSLDAAEVVCEGGDLVGNDILDGVAALVDKSLVVMDATDTDARYHLLETVRQYGRERLEDSGQADTVAHAHALYYLALVDKYGPRLIGGEDEVGVLHTVDREAANLRTACAWSLRSASRVEYALRFAHGLFWYWYGIGDYLEATAMMDGALALAPHGVLPLWQARAQASRAMVLLSQGDSARARALFVPAIAQLQQHGAHADELLMYRIKVAASYIMEGNGRAAYDALLPLEQAAQATPQKIIGVFWQFWTGWAALMVGELERARDVLHQSITTGFATGHEMTIAHGSLILGRLALMEQRADEAKHHLREALVRQRLMAEGWGISLSLSSVAQLLQLHGRHARAVEIQSAVDALRMRYRIGVPESERADRDRVLERGRTALGDAVFEQHMEKGRAMTRDQVIDLAIAKVSARPSGFPSNAADGMFASSPGISATGQHRAMAIARSRLTVRALGPLQVTLGGRVLDSAEWGSARPRELLMFLLLHPQGVTKEQVGLALWPDASAAQLRNSFHVTLHRLRKVLQVPGIVATSGERYHLETSALEEFDVTAFERETTAARRALRRQERDAMSQLVNALHRYKGDLLDGEPVGDWHLTFRDQLQTLFLDAAMDLGVAQIADERYDASVDTFRRVLAYDALNEGAVRGQMTALSRMGERSQALRVYERLVTGLQRELNARPDASTSGIATRIQRGDAV